MAHRVEMLCKHLPGQHDQRSHGVRHAMLLQATKAQRIGVFRLNAVPKELQGRFADFGGSPVVFTGPMLEKNRRHHPDVNGHYGYLSDLLGKPDRVRRNRRDAQILIFYKVVDTERGRRALRAAVVFPPDLAEGKLPSILSFRWAEKKAERRRELGMEKSFAGRLPTPGVSFGP